MSTYAIRSPSPPFGGHVREYVGSMAAEPTPPHGDAELVARLRAGDEDAFVDLVDRYGGSLLGVARTYVKDRAAAEEVVQETWLGVLQGIDRFEGRSSLKTWIFRILTNRAKTRGERESRTVPFSALGGGDNEASVEADRFLGPEDSEPGAWASPPRDWPQDRVLERETLDLIGIAIEQLPAAQREVIQLRDVAGWSAEDVARALEISDGNQRVLLHRARSKVRAALERHLDPEAAT